MTRRVTRPEAARLLGVSLSTLDRRISRGEVWVDLEPNGSHHRVWVLLPDEDAWVAGDDTDSSQMATFTLVSLTTKLAVLEEQVKSRAELIVYLRSQLTEADARCHLILARLEDVQRHGDDLSARALPEAKKNSHRWWPFGQN